MKDQEVLDVIVSFLRQIGIGVRYGSIEQETFLPGIEIVNGQILIDKDQLTYTGDILHEAGHIAVEEASKRHLLNGNVEPGSPAQSLELAAILWSYAAVCHLQLDPAIVFHEGGYKGESDWLIRQFEAGTYIGLPLIQWMGLALDIPNAVQAQVKPFPHMLKWLRE